ncbi:MAG: molybdopterin-dependent oxidoreductase [Dehalococcoidia bacterium]|nr:molybdopterin-dependent oxidoreductase [Dehalococcoidia bacterium]
MKKISMTINGRQVEGREGDTVLEVCQSNGIDVPTLCHIKGLSNTGACRMCVVEIEGERNVTPSCTYPARDGLIIKTDTERVEKYRRMVLELLFTERNHFCMFCEASGDCELQSLAYRYQMDNVRFHYNYPSLPTDLLNDYIAIDHNRCVLCGRCIRMCNEIAANHTLSFASHGWKTTVVADLNQPLGESSCTSCGACVQVCPTGAIFSRSSVYKGRDAECQEIKTACPLCSVGCELNVKVKDNNLVKIESPEPSLPKGTLCKKGRFDLLLENRIRITSPLMRNKSGKLEESQMADAIESVVNIAETRGNFAGIISTQYPNETLTLFQRFMRDVIGTDNIDTTDGKSYRLIAKGIGQFQDGTRGLDIGCSLEEILRAGCIMLVGADPLKTHPVVATFIKRAITERGAKLIVINSTRDVFPHWTDAWLKPEAGSEAVLLNGLAKCQGLRECAVVSKATGIDKSTLELASDMYGNATCGVIIYGEELLEKNNPNLVTGLLNIANQTGNCADCPEYAPTQLRVISLKPYANSRGGWDMGLANKALPDGKLKGAYLLLADGGQEDEKIITELRERVDFLVIQASYYSPAISVADLVLPSPIWSEREGTYTTTDGKPVKLRQVIKPRENSLQDQEIIVELARRLGHHLHQSREV